MPFRADLSDLAGLADDEIPLAEAALRIALSEYPHLDPAPWLGEVERLVERARALASGRGREELLGAANAALFVESRYRGNTADYYDPRNSFLNEVIERRTGIPITLSILYMEVGRRLGLTLRGVGFPGHFLVGWYDALEPIYIDVFDGGARLAQHECARLIPSADGAATLDESFFEPVSHRQILLRMLANLKLIYVRRKDYPRAIAAVDRILQLAPDMLSEVRDRGLIRLESGEPRLALADLERYIDTAPPGYERDAVVAAVGAARRAAARYN